MTTLGEYAKHVAERLMEYGDTWAADEQMADAVECLDGQELDPVERRWFWREVLSQLIASREITRFAMPWDHITPARDLVIEQLRREGVDGHEPDL